MAGRWCSGSRSLTPRCLRSCRWHRPASTPKSAPPSRGCRAVPLYSASVQTLLRHFGVYFKELSKSASDDDVGKALRDVAEGLDQASEAMDNSGYAFSAFDRVVTVRDGLKQGGG
jgi:hypothetical protein